MIEQLIQNLTVILDLQSEIDVNNELSSDLETEVIDSNLQDVNPISGRDFTNSFILHLPHEIPHSLTLFTFILLLLICTMFIIKLAYLIKPNIIRSKNIMEYLFSFCYKPPKFLDGEIKNQGNIKLYYKTHITLFNKFISKHFYILNFLELLPRLLLAITFVSDVFIFSRINYTYKVIPIIILIFISQYIRYMLEAEKKDLIIDCDKKTDLYLGNLSGPKIEINEYIKLQTPRVLDEKEEYIYRVGFWLKDEYWAELHKEANLEEKNRQRKERGEKELSLNIKVVNARLERILMKIVDLNITLVKYNNLYSKYKLLNIFIALLYIISWGYILLVSLHTLHFTSFDITLIKSFQKIIEPFSGISI